MADFSPELEDALQRAFSVTEEGGTVLLLFDDMFEINEHFQAVLDWYKDRGSKMMRRYGQGCFMERGMLYFAGADTHRYTRGIQLEIDLREQAHELVRKVGLEARLRAKGLA